MSQPTYQRFLFLGSSTERLECHAVVVLSLVIKTVLPFRCLLGIMILAAACLAQTSQSSSPPQDAGARAPATAEPEKAEPSATPPPADSTPLEAIKTVRAVYPLEAEQQQLQGHLFIRFLRDVLTSKGRVLAPTAVSTISV